MRRLLALCLGFLVIIALSGCATVVATIPEVGKDTESNGIRVYPPKVYFFVNVVVDEKKNPPVATVDITEVCLPDYEKGYDVKPLAVLSKNYFNMTLDKGQIVGLNANADSTAMVDVLKGVISASKTFLPSSWTAVLGGKSMAPKEKKALIDSWKARTGIYRLDDNGVLTKVNIGRSELMPQ